MWPALIAVHYSLLLPSISLAFVALQISSDSQRLAPIFFRSVFIEGSVVCESVSRSMCIIQVVVQGFAQVILLVCAERYYVDTGTQTMFCVMFCKARQWTGSEDTDDKTTYQTFKNY